MSRTEMAMKFRTESGSRYELQLVSYDADPQLYRVRRRDKKGDESEFIAEIMTRIPVAIGSRVLFLVHEEEQPKMIMTTRVLPHIESADRPHSA